MTNTHAPYPFQCPRCQQQPREAFRVLEGTNDWVIGYPELQLIHVHFGVSTQTQQENISMANFMLQWWESFASKNPGKRFFVISDLTRKDDAEVLEDETKVTLARIRKHPQWGGGALYGQTESMSMMLNLLAFLTKRPISLRRTLAECEADYEAWFAKEQQQQ